MRAILGVIVNKEIVKFGFIGLGQRGQFLLKTLTNIDSVKIIGVCDVFEERIRAGCEIVEEKLGYCPVKYSDYKELLKNDEIDAVIVATTWITHIKIAIAAMKANKHVGMEVGGAASVEECWDLVRIAEETGLKFMMLENICYADNELALFNMERQGLFGEMIHAQGGYEHDLQEEIILGRENKHGRLNNFINRNGELYPTHQLGPIAKILRINKGNRFLTLTSMASKSRGLHEWIIKNKGLDHYLANTQFSQGDIVTTMIKCAHGETILLTHGTTLPRPYSRDGRIQGTKGIWLEDSNSIYIHGISPYDEKDHPYEPHQWEKFDVYKVKYRHPLWIEYEKEGVHKEGHGGVDLLVLNSFIDSIVNDMRTPIDACDTAAWMSITCLSEQSIAMGSMPVSIPDFTNGQWISPISEEKSKYSLDDIYWECFI